MKIAESKSKLRFFVLCASALLLVACGDSSSDNSPEKRSEDANAKIDRLAEIEAELRGKEIQLINNEDVWDDRSATSWDGSDLDTRSLENTRDALEEYKSLAKEVLAISEDEDIELSDQGRRELLTALRNVDIYLSKVESLIDERYNVAVND